MKNHKKRWMCVIPMLSSPMAYADYQADIGYVGLHALLDANTPNGLNVQVSQVEASVVGSTDSKYPVYAPDPTVQAFAGKNFSFPDGSNAVTSGHATGVGELFYGNNAIAHGIGQITGYEANGWITRLQNNTLSSARVTNHSWVGNGDTTASNTGILRLVDRYVQRNEAIQVVGMANSASNSPLLGSAYNVISVGRTDGGHDYSTDTVDSVYVAGRTAPSVVAPESTTSMATPIVSAAAALLVETGHNGGLGLSAGSTTVNGIGTVYTAERSETIKAALMAGADRQTANTSIIANITDYRSNGHQTSNGLDDRFGAGQVNVLKGYEIIAAGEQNSLEDGGANAGEIGLSGFDYDTAFGGASSSNNTATYKLTAYDDEKLSASLVWNLGVANNSGLSTTLHNLDLELYDVTAQKTSVALSASSIDNTENLWVSLISGHSYELTVKSAEATNFSWAYALAWHTSPATAAPVPVPAAAWLFASAMLGLLGVNRRQRR